MASYEVSSPANQTDMDVGTVLHMKEGLGEHSYARNSSLQKKGSESIKHLIVNSAVDVYTSVNPQCFRIADFGCSSGTNALCTVKDIVEAVCHKSQELALVAPEFMVFLNDLPSNDFNTLFQNFSQSNEKISNGAKGQEDGPPFVCLVGLPGSFYGRLLPSNSVHLTYSYYSLHWLSQVPPGLFDHSGKSINKGKIWLSHTSPPDVASAYYQQFQKDFGLFLRSRSAELVSGGRMVLAMLGRSHSDIDRSTTILWDVLDKSFATMVSLKMINEDQVDAFNVPFYAPSIEEIEDLVRKDGTLILEKIQFHQLEIGNGDPKEDARIITMAVRAIQDSMICHHFGEDVMDDLFQIFEGILSELMVKEEVKSSYVSAILRKAH